MYCAASWWDNSGGTIFCSPSNFWTLLIEELEKQNEKVLLPLISVMGSGYLVKTNARIGRRVEQTQVVCWGTCNDAMRLRRAAGLGCSARCSAAAAA
jgi:hypothetical protein